MAAMPNRPYGTTCRLLILWHLWSAIHIASKRPQGQDPDGDDVLEIQPSQNDLRQLEGSLVEVGAHHLLLAAAPKEKLLKSQALQRGDVVEVLETFEGDKDAGTKPMAAIQLSPPGQAQDQPLHPPDTSRFDEFESGLSARPPTFDLTRDVQPDASQVPDNNAHHRPGALAPDTFSTGDRRLDNLQETDTPSLFRNAEPGRPRPLIDLDARTRGAAGTRADALFVPDIPERSHVEADMGGDNEAMDRYSHFQELLKMKPAVDKAIGYYRRDVGQVRDRANGLLRKTETAVKSVDQLNAGVKTVEDAEKGASKESEQKTRKLAIDSVQDFGMYNKHGVFGKDKEGEFSQEAGKWDIFKSLISQAKGLSVAELNRDRFQEFLDTPTERVAHRAQPRVTSDHRTKPQRRSDEEAAGVTEPPPTPKPFSVLNDVPHNILPSLDPDVYTLSGVQMQGSRQSDADMVL